MPLTKVTSGVIAANAVVDSFGTQSITGDKIGLTAINANNIVTGAVTGDKLGATSINANNIVGGTITTTQIASNTISNTNIATGAVENYMRASGGFNGMRNRIINGNMLIWQRGTSTSSTGYQTVDRWSGYADSGISVSRSSDVPANTGFFYSTIISGTGSTGLTQKIESYNANTLVGASATVSLWCKRTSGSGNIGVYLYSANTQDDFNNTTSIGSGTITPSTSWANYTLIFNNIPGAAANGIQFTVRTESASAVTMYFTGIQMESGSTPTPFEHRPYGTELDLARRYYQIVQGGSGKFQSLSVIQLYPVFGTAMRTTPTASLKGTVKIDNYAGADPTISNIGSQAGSGYTGINYVLFNLTGGSGTPSNGSIGNIYASGSINDGIAFSAEL